MKTLCIIPCGSKKVWDKDPHAGPTPARNVYVGPFAKKCKDYAERFYPQEWCILSAKYGFIFPDEIIPEPYNVSFNNKSSNPISVSELATQAAVKKLHDYDMIVVLGGKNYVHFAKNVFASKQIHTPLNDCTGIGYMMGKLNDAIKSGQII